ncbi:J domain-containing protein [Chitinivorax sp. B]|uniref:J domain-containing protein n=1 Tax=Chitinivorax sp. B TaxID=2502235 RepID=UPI0010F98315|nr:J domain-containing protein [Chitinivorax sp. B]
MTAWQILGIDPTPDVREIKRAYAKRLKITRPEDDPQGFQQLRDAYDWAQQWAMRPQETPAANDAVSLEDVVDTPPPEGPRAHPWQRQLISAIDDEPTHGIAVLQAALVDVGDAGRDVLEDMLVGLCLKAKSLSLGFMVHVADTFHWFDPAHRHAEELAALLAGMRHAQTAGVAQAAVTAISEATTQGEQAMRLLFQRALGNEALESLDSRALFEIYLMQWLASDKPPSDDFALFVGETLEWQHRNLHLRDADQEAWQRLAWRLDMALERRRLYAIARQKETSLKPEWVKPLSIAANAFLAPFNRLKLQWQALDLRNQMAGAYLVENWQRTHPVLLDEFDSRTVAFYRQDQPHLGQEPIKPIITIAIVAALFAMLSTLGDSSSHGPQLTTFLIHMLGIFVGGLAVYTIVPWFWRRFAAPFDERLTRRMLKSDPLAFERGFRVLAQSIRACVFAIPIALAIMLMMAVADVKLHVGWMALGGWVISLGTLYWRIRTGKAAEDGDKPSWWSQNWWWVIWVSFAMLRALSNNMG